MTWKEFKEEVEEKGITDDMEIWFIDVVYPYKNQIEVCPQDKNDPKDTGLVIY